MSVSAAFANDILSLVFHGTAIQGIAQNAATSPVDKLYIALHTADPGAAGNQSTNEVAYTGYARVALQRSASGWTITGNKVTLTDTVEFGDMTGGANGTATHVSIGTAATGAGKVIVRAALSNSVQYQQGIAPRLRSNTSITFVTT